MAHTVYILYSRKDGKLYVGCTSNIEERLKRHESGHVRATAHRRPLTLIKVEIFDVKREAFKRERYLKSLWGAREKKKILLEYLEGVQG